MSDLGPTLSNQIFFLSVLTSLVSILYDQRKVEREGRRVVTPPRKHWTHADGHPPGGPFRRRHVNKQTYDTTVSKSFNRNLLLYESPQNKWTKFYIFDAIHTSHTRVSLFHLSPLPSPSSVIGP